MTAESMKLKVPEICFSWPLYRVIVRGEAVDSFLQFLEQVSFTFDSYCTGCKREATFRRLGDVLSKPPPSVHQSGFRAPAAMQPGQVVRATCTRDPQHVYRFYFDRYRDGIAKVGQTPSLADILSNDLKQFRPLLEPLDRTELEQATRLHSVGAEIGAFVYLRRIFERIIERHRVEYEKVHGSIAAYDGMRMEDKVLALRDVLPVQVVQNRKVYGILSKAIHALTEEESANFHDIMRAAIIEILQSDLHARQRAESARKLQDAIATAAGQLKG